MAIKNAYKRKDGRWEVRFYIRTEPDGKRKYRSVYGNTKEAAEAKAALFYFPDIDTSVTEMTVRELALEYMERKMARLKESTAANYLMKLEKHIIPTLGDIRCSEVKAGDIYAFIERKRRNKLSERYIYDILVLLKSVFRYANITYGVKNIMSSVIMPKRTKPDVTILSDSEQARLKAYILGKSDLAALGISISLYTGLRIGEICALQWKDIDLEKRILTVSKTIQRVQTRIGKARTKIIIAAPKSASSIREIPIPECLVEQLKRFEGGPDSYLLSGTSKPVEPRTLQYRFARILNNANLPSVHFHSLRHAFATNCVNLGFDVKTLSEILGHSSVEITLNRYVHSSIDRKKAFMDKLTWDKVSA